MIMANPPKPKKRSMVTLTGTALLELTNQSPNIEFSDDLTATSPYFLRHSNKVKNDGWKLSDSIILKTDDSSSVFKLQLTLEPGSVDPRAAQLSVYIHEEVTPQFHMSCFKSCDLVIDLLGIRVDPTTDVILNSNMAQIRDPGIDRFFVFSSAQINFQENKFNKGLNSFDIWSVTDNFCDKVDLRKYCQLKMHNQLQGTHNEDTFTWKVVEHEVISARVTATLEIALLHQERKFRRKLNNEKRRREMGIGLCVGSDGSKADLLKDESLSPIATEAYIHFTGFQRDNSHLRYWFHWDPVVSMELLKFSFQTSLKCDSHGRSTLDCMQKLMEASETVLCRHLNLNFSVEMAIDIWNLARTCRRPHLESKSLYSIFRSWKRLQNPDNIDVAAGAEESQKHKDLLLQFVKHNKVGHTSLSKLLCVMEQTDRTK